MLMSGESYSSEEAFKLVAFGARALPAMLRSDVGDNRTFPVDDGAANGASNSASKEALFVELGRETIDGSVF